MNILVYRMGSLGDSLVALPSFYQIRKHYPNARITILTNFPVNQLAAPLEQIIPKQYFDEIVYFPTKLRNIIDLIKLYRCLKSKNFSKLIYLITNRNKIASFRDAVFFRFCGISDFIGLSFFNNKLEYFKVKETGLTEPEYQRIQRKISVLGNLDFNTPEIWDLHFTKEEIHYSDTTLIEIEKSTVIITFSIGAKNPEKLWGFDNWSVLIKHLSEKYRTKVTLIGIGASKEYKETEKLLENFNGMKINICGKASPRESGAILRNAKVFIGHDSGPMHLAATVNVPCIALFALQNRPGQWFPRGNNNSVFYPYDDTEGLGVKKFTPVQVFNEIISKIGIEELK